MRYQANPVRVSAHKIVSVSTHFGADGSLDAQLDDEDNSIVNLTAEMISRYTPVIGDYFVIQSDGYLYVNPVSVFERKYSPVPNAEPVAETDGIEILSDGTIMGRADRIDEFREFCKARGKLLG